MKKQMLLSLIAAIMVLGSFTTKNLLQKELAGAWQLKTGDMEELIVFQDGYFSYSVFDKRNKKFVSTYGGIFGATGEQLKLKTEFDTRDAQNVGKEQMVKYTFSGDQLAITLDNSSKNFSRVDEGKGALAGVWRITGRMVDGKLNQMQRGDRKTLKLLSGTRFQWMAINPATKEFFGTGGGTYTFKNGRYEETIEFFSRDSSRVGASLSFDGSVKDGVWNHSGKSSKGDPLSEVWTKEKY